MILDSLLGVKSLASSEDRFWRDVAESWGLGKTSSGKAVNEDTALTISAVYRAVQLIAGTVATLPLHIYRRVSDDERQRDSGNPLEALLNRQPNEYMDAVTYREVITSNVLLWGNGYSEIVRAGNRVVALYPIASRRVTPKIAESGRLEYHVSNETGQPATVLKQDSVLHVKGLSGDGLAGWSVIRKARESLGLSMAAEQFGASFFGNASRPAGILKSPQRLEDKTINRLRAEWDAMQSGAANTGRPAILTGGMDWQSVSIPPDDAQFMETRKLQVVEVSRWFGVAPHLLYDLERATFSNIEHQGLEFLSYCLRYWLTKWESAIRETLLAEDLYAEHLTDALVRADLKARYEAYAVGRNNGWLSINDILRRENMNPIGPEGDVRLAPVNMVPLETLLNPPEPEPAPAPIPAVEDGDEEEKEPAGNVEATAAMRGLLLATARRMARRHVAAAMTAARRPGRFLDWLNEWAAHEQAVTGESLGPVLEAWGAVVGSAPAGAASLAAEYVTRARDQLLDVAGSNTPDWLGDGVTAWAEAWERDSPEWLAERVRQ